ncbi:MAG: adenosylmethionine--8-amino-7-oxononanoate transaminase [Pseudarcicella sp.]|nr:adenosylmethionine--8-amino-7-oxononanoate transaminase [Pseudarcicella sp.]MBP6411021.1 adenosylmethionine--8-amino-7-oxononanoate transaminase [Pseudarcicella sp.]
MKTLSERDQSVVWHPFTQHKTSPISIAIKRAEGVYLYDENDKQYIDAISSWWVNIHGHAHPYIAQKVYEQFLKLEQVIFAGFTHEPAIELAEKILTHLPDNQSKIFYSDNGSTAVEVALKMAIQYFYNQGNTQKKKIIALENAYHGDTFGTMSVGAKSSFNAPFDEFLFDVIYLKLPPVGSEKDCIADMKTIMTYADEIAGFVFEPLVQGAGGMIMYSPELLDELIGIAQKNNIICIADEIMTGFFRTGKMFATDFLANNKPDVFCLSKGLTGGAMAMGITSCTQAIFQAFLSDQKAKTLFHSHSFTANPLACVAGLASLELLFTAETQENIARITRRHQHFMMYFLEKKMPFLREIRQQGTILALEIETGESTSYFHSIRDIAYNYFIEKGILLRPLGNIIYILAPYCISDDDLDKVYTTIESFFDFLNEN